jgi:hypothetical protein
MGVRKEKSNLFCPFLPFGLRMNLISYSKGVGHGTFSTGTSPQGTPAVRFAKTQRTARPPRPTGRTGTLRHSRLRLRQSTLPLLHDQARRVQVESLPACPPLAGNLLVCCQNQVPTRPSSQVARDRRLDVDGRLHGLQPTALCPVPQAICLEPLPTGPPPLTLYRAKPVMYHLRSWSGP